MGDDSSIPSKKEKSKHGSVFKTAIGALGRTFKRQPLPEFSRRPEPNDVELSPRSSRRQQPQTLSKASSTPARMYLAKGSERGSFSPEAERLLRSPVARTSSQNHVTGSLSPDPSQEQNSMRRAMSFAVIGGFGRKARGPEHSNSIHLGNDTRGIIMSSMPKAGSLFTLLNWMLFENIDVKEFDAVVLSYRAVGITPEDMITGLSKIFTSLSTLFCTTTSGPNSDQNLRWNQKRLIRFATLWLKNLTVAEKTPELNEMIEAWVGEVEDVGEPLTYDSRCLRSIISGGMSDSSRYRFSPAHNRSMTPTTTHLTNLSLSAQVMNPKTHTHSFHISHFPAAMIAKQLHFIEFNLLKKIETSTEFVGIGWSTQEKHDRCPNIMAMIQRFNSVAYWIATKIITAKSNKKKLGMLIHFIHVADECRAQNNFNSLMEILAGINNFNVTNLTDVWKSLPEKWASIFADLENLMSSQNNYKNYRRYFAGVFKDDLNNSKLPPILPYLGLYLRDVTFVHEGNADTTPDGLINLDKLGMLGAMLSQFYEIQQQEAAISEEEQSPILINALHNLVVMDEDGLYQFNKDSKYAKSDTGRAET